MELLKHFAAEFAENQMQKKGLMFENEKYPSVSVNDTVANSLKILPEEK